MWSSFRSFLFGFTLALTPTFFGLSSDWDCSSSMPFGSDIFSQSCARGFATFRKSSAVLCRWLFFVTPVIYLPEQLAQRSVSFLKWNPFANLLEVVRDPILGMVPSQWAIMNCVLLLGGLK